MASTARNIPAVISPENKTAINPENLADQLQLFLNNGVGDSVIETAYQFAVNHFDIKIVAEKYIEEYKKLI